MKSWASVGAGVALCLLVGCGETKPPSNTPTPNSAMSSSASDGEPAASPALTDEDQALIVKQEICPVGGEKLGSMGTPVKVTVKDRTVFLCCKSCKEAIERDPDTYLAKLDAHVPAAPAVETPAAEAPAAEAPAAEAPAAEAPAAEAPAAEAPAAEAPAAEAPAKTE